MGSSNYHLGNVSDVFSRVRSPLAVDIWQSTIQVLKEVMDALASNHFLVEDDIMARLVQSVVELVVQLDVKPEGGDSCASLKVDI
ncbi:hypothetical protein Vadar_010716 [Vaccinium darrowii]|uniref:Uncharacterized protein n=1 Tax=Vaccinium darrowii TaxID=229202 RepID=A0ACB7XGN9_9ERIC|nr:hypothetical protein Vadar_010716 [Vaccinium darrowii]